MRQNITFYVIHVKVSSNFRCSRTLPMNVAIESAHCGCEIHAMIGIGRRCVESMVEYGERPRKYDTMTFELV